MAIRRRKTVTPKRGFSMSAHIKGLGRIQKRMTDTVKEMSGDPIRSAMARAVLLVLRGGRKNAPVDTGRLRASITPEIVTRDTVVKGVIGSNVFYAPFQEFGTKHFKGVRYLQRALNDNARRIFKLLGNAVAGVIKRGGD